jgi:hypothetical protein
LRSSRFVGLGARRDVDHGLPGFGEVRRLLVIAVLIELGLLLIVVPWSAYWDRNYFAQLSPIVEAVVVNNYVRGAVTGLGAVNVLAALADLAVLVRRRRVS